MSDTAVTVTASAFLKEKVFLGMEPKAYARSLFDAWRVAQARADAANGKAASSRADDAVFLLLGIGVLALSFMQLGGFVVAPSRTLLPLAAIAVGLVVAHETRR